MAGRTSVARTGGVLTMGEEQRRVVGAANRPAERSGACWRVHQGGGAQQRWRRGARRWCPRVVVATSGKKRSRAVGWRVETGMAGDSALPGLPCAYVLWRQSGRGGRAGNWGSGGGGPPPLQGVRCAGVRNACRSAPGGCVEASHTTLAPGPSANPAMGRNHAGSGKRPGRGTEPQLDVVYPPPWRVNLVCGSPLWRSVEAGGGAWQAFDTHPDAAPIVWGGSAQAVVLALARTSQSAHFVGVGRGLGAHASSARPLLPAESLAGARRRMSRTAWPSSSKGSPLLMDPSRGGKVSRLPRLARPEQGAPLART